MSNCTVLGSGFSGIYASLNGNTRITITRMQLVWGLLTLGKNHWHQLLTEPEQSLNDVLHNWTELNTYLVNYPHLTITERFAELDPSDKASRSYRIGMGIAKVVADRLLRVPYLLHVDKLISAGVIATTPGSNERGDLVGMDKQRNWHVVEAKGRTYPVPQTVMNQAKLQAQRIVSIGGRPPLTKNYCITHIDKISCDIYLHDPSDPADESITISLEKQDFIRFYYDQVFMPFYDSIPLFSLHILPTNMIFDCFTVTGDVTLELADQLYVGLERRVLDKLHSGSPDLIIEFSGLSDLENDEAPEGIAFGSDGIIVVVESFFTTYKNVPGFSWKRFAHSK
jgi:hypothetical protein